MHSFARCAFASQNAMFFPRRAGGASWDFLRCRSGRPTLTVVPRSGRPTLRSSHAHGRSHGAPRALRGISSAAPRRACGASWDSLRCASVALRSRCRYSSTLAGSPVCWKSPFTRRAPTCGVRTVDFRSKPLFTIDHTHIFATLIRLADRHSRAVLPHRPRVRLAGARQHRGGDIHSPHLATRRAQFSRVPL
jgi:hypothetical protein